MRYTLHVSANRYRFSERRTGLFEVENGGAVCAGKERGAPEGAIRAAAAPFRNPLREKMDAVVSLINGLLKS
jgi:hypothetical protein